MAILPEDTAGRRVGEVMPAASSLSPPDPPLALSRHAHDRIGSQRVDEQWLARAWESDNTRVLLLHDGKVALDPDHGGPAYLRPSQAEPGERLLLGAESGTTYFAVLLDDPPEGMPLAGLREIASGLPDRDSGLLVHAVGMANWRHAHRFCPRCGRALQMARAGHVLVCAQGHSQFPRTDPAVIMLVTDDHDRCLLGHAARSPRPRGFSTLAGFVEPGESLEHAVVREVGEEVGIKVDEARYFGSQPWPLPASLMVGFFAHASTVDVDVDGDEIGEARWFSRAELLAATTSGDVVLPGRVSIARRLIEQWYGGELPGAW
ncbi:MAG TPA: NAD(+) diphosphatase [Nocardioidaceae bacterium]|nr:NAD(+) diphosphatase [Nocardioidaceae bacterium]